MPVYHAFSSIIGISLRTIFEARVLRVGFTVAVRIGVLSSCSKLGPPSIDYPIPLNTRPRILGE
ncbi:hypothetical protein [Legionella sainthelensi]|uniref:hypothetical protein n=1 Tax=Legionella sainthelensi TaxID=28087 RepID=UPI001E604802|nr:hypothetical protein [Legionella sainthelensi]